MIEFEPAASVHTVRRYLLTVVAAATANRSEVVVVIATVAKVARSAHVELSDECCTLITDVELRVLAVTCNCAIPPFVDEAALSWLVVVVLADTEVKAAKETP